MPADATWKSRLFNHEGGCVLSQVLFWQPSWLKSRLFQVSSQRLFSELFPSRSLNFGFSSGMCSSIRSVWDVWSSLNAHTCCLRRSEPPREWKRRKTLRRGLPKNENSILRFESASCPEHWQERSPETVSVSESSAPWKKLEIKRV